MLAELRALAEMAEVALSSCILREQDPFQVDDVRWTTRNFEASDAHMWALERLCEEGAAEICTCRTCIFLVMG